MKAFILALFVAAASSTKLNVADDVDNATKFWGKDWEKYRAAREDNDNNNCRIRESQNFFGAQQC